MKTHRSMSTTLHALALGAGLSGLSVATPARADMSHLTIVGGAPEQGLPAVGALVEQGEWYCSGTLVSPTVVITAGHCVEGMSPESMQFFVGADASNLEGGKLVQVKSVHSEPGYANDDTHDIGVVVLADVAPAIPIPVRLSALPDVTGQSLLFVGYGLTSGNGTGGQKRAVEIPISAVRPNELEYSDPQRNTCSGDSGGPALMNIDGALHLVAVTSAGDADCTEWGVNIRTDAFASFLEPFLLAAAESGETPEPEPALPEPEEPKAELEPVPAEPPAAGSQQAEPAAPGDSESVGSTPSGSTGEPHASEPEAPSLTGADLGHAGSGVGNTGPQAPTAGRTRTGAGCDASGASGSSACAAFFLALAGLSLGRRRSRHASVRELVGSSCR